jgi:hypothetical protein
MLSPIYQVCYSSIVYDLFCHCLVHVKMCRFPCTGNGCNVHTYLSYGDICIAPDGASVGCVGFSVRIVPEIMRGGGEITTVDIAFIVSIESGNPCSF